MLKDDGHVDEDIHVDARLLAKHLTAWIGWSTHVLPACPLHVAVPSLWLDVCCGMDMCLARSSSVEDCVALWLGDSSGECK